MNTLKKVAGTWRGTYEHELRDTMPRREPVPFVLILNQGWFGRWFGRFTGIVAEDATRGMPGTGLIKGFFSYPRIQFHKKMPVGYVSTPGGRSLTLRDYLIEKSHVCNHDIPHRPIFYQGTFSDPRHAYGTWIIEAGPLALGDGRVIKMGKTKGTWKIEAGPAQ